MAFGPVENFRNFLSSRPPLVLFIVCIGMVAIAFISYAYYIKYNDVYNPDANEKLDKFVHNVTTLNWCTKLSNKSWTLGHSSHPNNVTLNQILSDLHPDEMKNPQYDTISFTLSVSLSLVPKKDSFPRPVTDFVSSFPASLLGVSGEKENSSVAIEMVPASPVNLKCTNKVCLSQYKMCATILALKGIIPSYARQQRKNQCSYPKDNSTNAFIAWLDVTDSKENRENVAECESNILLKLDKVKEQFTVMLTLQERSAVNRHLMHSSYFLFVVVITILLFGIITGGRERKHTRSQGNHYSIMGP